MELGEITHQLLQPTCRLLNLTGMGGVGKSRLAIQATYELLRAGAFQNGIYHVALEALTKEELILSSIADRLNLHLTGQGNALDHIARHIDDKYLLLILDNFEHLINGALALPKLLQDCPNLKILATSRERLTLEQEWVFPVEGLALPSKDLPLKEAQCFDAIQLFVQRARQVQLTFELTPDELPHVLKLCRLVAGSPLALELAAVWVTVMSPGALALELERNLDVLSASARDRTERHKSLRAVFEHSWRLLSTQEQEVLKNLSVFRGGFTREAALKVTGASLTILVSLVNKSLLRVLPSGRYDRHPLLYQYTQEKLAADASELKKMHNQHFDYFLTLAEKAKPLLDGPEQSEWLERLEQDHDNFRTALSYALNCEDAEKALSLSGNLWWFWHIRGYYTEGREWLEKGLAQPSLATQVRAQALQGAGGIATRQGDYQVAKGLFDQKRCYLPKTASNSRHC